MTLLRKAYGGQALDTLAHEVSRTHQTADRGPNHIPCSAKPDNEDAQEILAAQGSLNSQLSTLNQIVSGRRHIPISFVASRLAVNEETLIEMFGLNDGRSERAAKAALARILVSVGMSKSWLRGRVMPLKPIERALEGKAEILKS